MMLVMKYSSGSPLRGVFLRHKLAISLVICLPLRRGLLGRRWWVTPQIWVEGGFRGQPPRLTFWVQILTCYFIVMWPWASCCWPVLLVFGAVCTVQVLQGTQRGPSRSSLVTSWREPGGKHREGLWQMERILVHCGEFHEPGSQC